MQSALIALEQNPASQEEAKAIYSCPMHPEIRREAICGASVVANALRLRKAGF